jgi:hypothetical protein
LYKAPVASVSAIFVQLQRQQKLSLHPPPAGQQWTALVPH